MRHTTILALIGACISMTAFTQTPIRCPGPLSEQQLTELISGGVAESRVIDYVRQCGISFQFTADSESRLRRAGAKDAAIAAIRTRSPQPKPAPDAGLRAELDLWNSIKESDGVEAFADYLKRYPKGQFAREARARIVKDKDPYIRQALQNGDWDEAEKTIIELLSLNLVPNELNAWWKTLGDGRGADSLREEFARLKFEFVKISPGEFLMGCFSADKECDDDEKPARSVRITKPFEVGKYEVTQGLWLAVMGRLPNSLHPGDDLPVQGVSWNDVQRFLEEINELGDGYRYRLPTEAEWEYAARAGTASAFTQSFIERSAWFSSNSVGASGRLGPKPVGVKEPNAWGLYDMLGNVTEWVSDFYQHDYYRTSPNIDPQGPLTGTARVRRGGSFFWDRKAARPTFRDPLGPDFQVDIGGFRCVREAVSLPVTPITDIRPENESTAAAVLRLINTAELTFSSQTGKVGEIPDLIAADLLGTDFARGTGYNFYVIPGKSPKDYVAEAKPISPALGRYAFFTTLSDGIIRYSKDPSLSPPGRSGQPVE